MIQLNQQSHCVVIDVWSLICRALPTADRRHSTTLNNNTYGNCSVSHDALHPFGSSVGSSGRYSFKILLVLFFLSIRCCCRCLVVWKLNERRNLRVNCNFVFYLRRVRGELRGKRQTACTHNAHTTRIINWSYKNKLVMMALRQREIERKREGQSESEWQMPETTRHKTHNNEKRCVGWRCVFERVWEHHINETLNLWPYFFVVCRWVVLHSD